MDSHNSIFRRVATEALRVADQLDQLRSQTRHAAEAHTLELRMLLGELEEHLKNNVSNEGETLELHKFPDRKIPTIDRMYHAAADKCGTDGELEFDLPLVVSESDDGGAYVMGWYFVYARELKPLKPFQGIVYMVDEQKKHHHVDRVGVLAVDEEHAREIILETHWDKRYTDQGCSPHIEWEEPDVRMYLFASPEEDEIEPIKVKATSLAQAVEALKPIYPDITVEACLEERDVTEDDDDD